MEFLPEILKATIDRVKNELLLFAIVIIVLILLFPEKRFEIAIVGIVFAIIYSVIIIKTTKPISENPDYISKEDWPTVKGRILENLNSDNERLDILVPLLKDIVHDIPVDEKYAIKSSLTPLHDRLGHLRITARSKIDNEDEIKLIQDWLGSRHRLNKQLSMRARAEYIQEKEASIRKSITDLIRFYE